MLKLSKYYGTVLFSILTLAGSCQKRIVDQIKSLEGIWIAEDYLKSFDITRSSIKSARAFDPDDPVGLRINTLEIRDSTLNIGYSTLHDHSIYPEISKYVVIDSDTIHEQGHFEINISKSDSLNFHKTSEIYYFNYECKSFFSWTFSPDTLLILHRPPTEKEEEKTIVFKRIINSFKPNFQFPNPLYLYTRSKTLAGTYTLRDSMNKVVSTNFKIYFDGKTSGYAPFKDKIFYFSTDIYCGPPASEDYISLCSYNEKLESDCNGYIYKRIDDKTIQFHKSEWISTPDNYEKHVGGKMIYKLTKKD
jgi:hypothetical protein